MIDTGKCYVRRAVRLNLQRYQVSVDICGNVVGSIENKNLTLPNQITKHNIVQT